jgi:hypothetical protein
MTILMSATVMAGAVIGGAFIVGTFVALANVSWTVFGVPVAAAFGAVCAATLVFWVGVYAAIRPRLKKISLARYLKPRPPA